MKHPKLAERPDLIFVQKSCKFCQLAIHRVTRKERGKSSQCYIVDSLKKLSKKKDEEMKRLSLDPGDERNR